jgi:hypothetical protein
MWTFTDANQRIVANEIERQSDRSAAVIAGAFLEYRLEEAIKAALERNIDIENRMFKGPGPLASFSAKIDIGFLLGLYNDGVRRKLHTIKEVRNRFAHSMQPITFRSQAVRDLCGNLAKVGKRMYKTPNQDAIQKAQETGNISYEWMDELVFSSVFNVTNTPRNRFIATTKALLLLLSVAARAAYLRAQKHPLPFASPDTLPVPDTPAPRNDRQKRKRRKRRQQPSPA